VRQAYPDEKIPTPEVIELVKVTKVYQQ